MIGRNVSDLWARVITSVDRDGPLYGMALTLVNPKARVPALNFLRWDLLGAQERWREFAIQNIDIGSGPGNRMHKRRYQWGNERGRIVAVATQARIDSPNELLNLLIDTTIYQEYVSHYLRLPVGTARYLIGRLSFEEEALSDAMRSANWHTYGSFDQGVWDQMDKEWPLSWGAEMSGDTIRSIDTAIQSIEAGEWTLDDLILCAESWRESAESSTAPEAGRRLLEQRLMTAVGPAVFRGVIA